MSDLASRIEAALKGKSIKDVAAEWGVPRWVLDDVRHGRIKMPGVQYLIPIAKGLGVSVEELLTPQEVAS